MALPTTLTNVTTRKLGSTLNSLWTKAKATFFKPNSGTTTLASNSAVTIGTLNGEDVKLKLPTIPAAANNGALQLQLNGGTATSKFTANQSSNSTLAFSTGSTAGTFKVDSTEIAIAGFSNKADKASVTAATKCKITYNAQGVVTAGADLAASDIPNLAESKITTKYDKLFGSRGESVAGRYVHVCTVRQTGDNYGVAVFLLSNRFWNYQHDCTDIITISLADSGGQNTAGNVYVKRVNLARSEANVQYFYVVSHPAAKDISVDLWKYSGAGNSTGDLSVKLLNLSRATNTWGTTVQSTKPDAAVYVPIGGIIGNTDCSQVTDANNARPALPLTDTGLAGDYYIGTTASNTPNSSYNFHIHATIFKNSSGYRITQIAVASASSPVGIMYIRSGAYDGTTWSWGTWTTFAKSGDITTAIQALDVSSVGGDGKYISAISETDGKISATATTMDTTPTANSTKAVTSGGIKTALDGKADKVSITGATKCKITYNSQGIVTAGANLAESDIPTLNWNKLWNTTLSFHRDLDRGADSGDNKKWTKILTKTVTNYATNSVWGVSTVIYDVYNNGYGSPNIPYIGTLELKLVWGHSAGSGYSLKTSGTKYARWIKWNGSFMATTDPLTASDRTGRNQIGGIYVKVLAVSDDTVEWWIYNNIWDTGVLLYPRYYSNVTPLAYSASNTKMSDELIDYISTTGATVTNYTLGDGAFINYSLASNNTKVTTATTTKAYLTAATATNYSSGGQTSLLADTGVYLTTTAGELVATKFTGSLTGNVTGNCSGSSGSCTGNAATATDLAANSILSVGKGGTGKSSVTANSFLVGNGTSALVEKTPTEVRTLIGAGTSSLTLGNGAGNAYYGDKGKTAYDHSQSTHAPTTSKSESSGGTETSLVTTGEKYTWNHKQSALPTSGTPSTTYAINVSGSASSAASATNVALTGSVKTTSTTNGDTIQFQAGSGTAGTVTIVNAKHAASADTATSADLTRSQNPSNPYEGDQIQIGTGAAITLKNAMYAYRIGYSESSDNSVGNSTTPICIDSNGFPVTCGFTVGKSVPSNAVFTDTKNTAGSTDTSSKIYLIGATTQAANPQTYSQDTTYVDTDATLASTKVRVAEKCTLQFNTTTNALDFVFA